jgi:hypothetical protein
MHKQNVGVEDYASLERKTVIVKAVSCRQEDVYGSFETITFQIKVAYLGPIIRSIFDALKIKK